MKTLKDSTVGEMVKVTSIQGHSMLKRRMMDMGITKGVEIFVKKVAPFGDPVDVIIRGYDLSLRKADAECILIES